jgi:hypothetical protein
MAEGIDDALASENAICGDELFDEIVEFRHRRLPTA